MHESVNLAAVTGVAPSSARNAQNLPDLCAWEMQYVRSISGSVSKTWNSINPATLSGAIDVIVIEQEDGESGAIPDRPALSD